MGAGVYATGAVAGAPAAVYAGAGSYAGAPVVSAPAVVGQTHQTYAAGAPTVQQHTEYGVVGHQVVQTGVKSVVAGHQFAVAGVEHLPQPATSYVAGVVKNSAVTVPIAPPVFPIAPAPLAAIPAAPRNLGPAPADTVTQQKILAPVRSHVRITPQATNIIPQINVQKYNVDVPVHVPTPIAREIIVNKHVAAPYNVASPVPSLWLLPTRSTPSRRSSRLPTSTTPPTPPTLPKRSSLPSTLQSTLSPTRLSVSRGLLSMLVMLLLDPLLPLPMSLLLVLLAMLLPLLLMPLPLLLMQVPMLLPLLLNGNLKKMKNTR